MSSRLIRLFVLLVVVLGCGGADELDKFVGTWQPAAGGVLTLSCPDGIATSAVTTPTTFSRGTSSDLVSTDGSCSILFDVSGETATARLGQSCNSNDGQLSLTLFLSAWTFHTSDGATATENASGSARLSDLATGAAETCSVTEQASYTRISR